MNKDGLPALNRLLQRQVQKIFRNSQVIPEELLPLLKVVSDSYDHFERDRKMLERSIELSSAEMITLNKNLRRESDEAKKAQEHALISERRFRNMIENSADMISLMNAENKFVYVSSTAVKKFGFTLEDYGTMTSNDVFHPEDVEIAAEVMQRVKNSPGISIEAPPVRKKCSDGSYLWIEGTLTNMLEVEGVNAIVANFRDITSRRQAEEKIRKSEEQYRTTLNNLMEGAHIIGHDWKYIYVNDVFAKHAKYKKEDLVGFTIHEKFPGIEHTLVYSKFKECFAERKPLHFEDEITFSDRTTAWFDISLQPVPEGIFVLSVDITERKKAELQMNAQNEELRKANSELDKFVYSVSHDLRAPLLSMQGIIEITESETEEEITSEHMKMLKQSIFKLDGFIGEILEYSRNSRGEIKPVKIDFNNLLNEVTSNLKFMNGANHQVQIIMNIKQENDFYTDRGRLNIILNNLISNSIRYCNPKSENSWVDIEIRSDSDYAQITVKDNGIGISKDHFPKIYDMFYRVSESSVGSGLGLYIAKEAVTRLSGEITLESEPGKGTSFFIKIPNLLFS